jgi:choline dehydrogenase-like flavoprotein
MLADQERTTGEMMRAAGLEEIRWERYRRKQVLSNLLLKRVTSEHGFFYPGAAIHECGGAAMGTDPENSVLNRMNQCWDAPNVFVTDGSCFVTSPAVNLTNTIMAITVRACDNIVRLLAGGEI